MSRKNQAMTQKATISMAAVSVLALLVGCGGGNDDSASAEATAADSAEVTENLQDSDVLRVATLGNNAPWSNTDSDGEQVGFDVDLARALADQLGVDIEFTTVDGPGRVAALQSNQADLTIGEFASTPERAEVVSFSQEYVLNPAQFMVRADSGIESSEDLDDPSNVVCVQQGGTSTDLVPEYIPDVDLLFLPSVNDCLEAVTSGQADAMSETAFTYIPLMEREPDTFEILEGSFGTNYISIGYQQGSDDLGAYLDGFLEDYQGDGRLEESFEDYFGLEMPEEARPDWFTD